MSIDPVHHIYNIQLTENVIQWNLFISIFSSVAHNDNAGNDEDNGYNKDDTSVALSAKQNHKI